MIFQFKPFHDPMMHSAESRMLKVIGSKLSQAIFRKFCIFHGLIEVRGNSRVALEPVSSHTCHRRDAKRPQKQKVS